MTSVRFHPKASEELHAVASYYEGKRSGLGVLFIAEAKRSRDRIVELSAAAREVRKSILRRSIRRIPYFLFYSVEEKEIFIVAVAHRRRRPEYWEKRMKATIQVNETDVSFTSALDQAPQSRRLFRRY